MNYLMAALSDECDSKTCVFLNHQQGRPLPIFLYIQERESMYKLQSFQSSEEKE